MKTRVKAVMGTVLGLVVVATLVNASIAVAAGPGGRNCFKGNCLDVWQPVQCSDGNIYSNSCYAARACATGCHPVTE